MYVFRRVEDLRDDLHISNIRLLVNLYVEKRVQEAMSRRTSLAPGTRSSFILSFRFFATSAWSNVEERETPRTWPVVLKRYETTRGGLLLESRGQQADGRTACDDGYLFPRHTREKCKQCSS